MGAAQEKNRYKKKTNFNGSYARKESIQEKMNFNGTCI